MDSVYLPFPLEQTMYCLNKAEDFRPQNLPNPELLVTLKSKATKNKSSSCLWEIERHQLASWNSHRQISRQSSKTAFEIANTATSTIVWGSNQWGHSRHSVLHNREHEFQLKQGDRHPVIQDHRCIFVMCFPTLFPNGRFGPYHHRPVNLNLA